MGDFPYPVDYNDHFETPLKAYEDVAPLIDWLFPHKKVILYDPYYCDGRTGRLLRQLGYQNVVHEKRDFYVDQEKNTVPEYDFLITNPPYSDQHKIKCLDFCSKQLTEQGKPCCILMPSYVAARQYFRDLNGIQDFCFIIPSLKYSYDHPMGTGKETSPFDSVWFCGIGKRKIEQAKKFWDSAGNTMRTRFALSLAELVSQGIVSTKKRPNPKQRRKRKARLLQSNTDDIKPASAAQSSVSSSPVETTCNQSAKRSKYRDTDGKRTKKRF